MMSFNFLSSPEFGETTHYTRKKFLFITQEIRVFEPSKTYIIVDDNPKCPTVIGHPSVLRELTSLFFAVPDVYDDHVTCENGVPVSWKSI